MRRPHSQSSRPSTRRCTSKPSPVRILNICLLFAATAYEVAQTVHIERKSEAQSLVERTALCRGKHIRSVQLHHIQRKARAEPEVASPALVGMLIVVAYAGKELLIVAVLCTERQRNLLNLLLESSRSVIEALEDTRNRRHGLPFSSAAL